MKNINIIILIIGSIILVTEIFVGYYILTYKKDMSIKEQSYKTFLTVEGKEIKYDEQYVLNVAIIVYEQLYNEKHLPSDFVIENKKFGDYGSAMNVYLKETRENIIGDGDIVYDGLTGLLISKENGGILANFGEY